MAKKVIKTRVENVEGTSVFYPHTSADVVFDDKGKSLQEHINEGVIDDTKTLKSKTWSSNKINGEVVKIYGEVGKINTKLETKQNTILSGTTAPNNNDGKPNGTIYVQIVG